jgi:hypothetical protein
VVERLPHAPVPRPAAHVHGDAAGGKDQENGEDQEFHNTPSGNAMGY